MTKATTTQQNTTDLQTQATPTHHLPQKLKAVKPLFELKKDESNKNNPNLSQPFQTHIVHRPSLPITSFDDQCKINEQTYNKRMAQRYHQADYKYDDSCFPDNKDKL